MMNLNDFRYVTTIAKLGSFTSAAKALFITPPSLSQRVKYIESTYGIRIFDRDASGVKLTSDGECFVEYATKILSNNADLEAELLYRKNAMKTTLRIGLSWLLNTSVFYHLLFRFCAEHPQMHFELSEQTSVALQQSLLSHQIDIALCYLPVASPDLSYEIVYNDRFVLVPAAGSALEQKLAVRKIQPGSYINPQLLDGEPFAICTPGSLLHKYLSTVTETEHIQPEFQHTIRGVPLLYAIAENGIASTVLYKSFFLSDSIDAPYYYLESNVSNNLSLAMVWRKGSHYRHLAKDFIQLI